MIFDACCGHGLRMRDARIVAVDKDPSVRNVFRQKVCWPKFAICMRPCLEGMIGLTPWIETMDKDKASGEV